MTDNREWAHREAQRRARSLVEPMNIFKKNGMYIVRSAATHVPHITANAWERVATIQPDGSYSFGSKTV
jgi:hypothetical protein